MSLTNNEASAADLVQETIVNALRALDRFQPGTNARAWLMRILFNLFVDGRRRDARETLLGDQATSIADARLDPSEPEPPPPPAEDITMETIREAVLRLPSIFREPFELRMRGTQSYHRIAVHLGIRPRTVGTRLHRGRQLLRRMLTTAPID
jgi:RNA polymerase sigma-70 factor (ECF subfamily)